MDIRLYYYDGSGVLKKVYPKWHRYNSIQACLNNIDIIRNITQIPFNRQYVIVEYASKYESKIIQVI